MEALLLLLQRVLSVLLSSSLVRRSFRLHKREEDNFFIEGRMAHCIENITVESAFDTLITTSALKVSEGLLP